MFSSYFPQTIIRNGKNWNHVCAFGPNATADQQEQTYIKGRKWKKPTIKIRD